MSRARHDRWDNGESLAGWDHDKPRVDPIPYLIALIVAGCVVVGLYALARSLPDSAHGKAPPVSEAGRAPSSSTEPTKGASS